MSATQGPPSQGRRYDPQPGKSSIKLSPASDLLKSKEEDLLARADECLSRAGSVLEVPPKDFDDLVKLRLSLEAQACVAEVLRRRADETAERDRKRESRHFWIELFFTILITALICWEINEGRQQAAILQQMNKNTADTAVQIQKAGDAITATLQVLQADRADRLAQLARKPRLALYVGNVPIDRATVRLAPGPGVTQDTASIALSVKNVGDAPVSTFRLHAHAPADVRLDLESFLTVPQSELPPNPNIRRVTLQLPTLPAGETVRVGGAIYAPKGHSAFKITFTVDAFELQAVTSPGSLTVLPPEP